ncbi:MAG: flavin reductase family protein [Galactobacter sp.]
MSIIITEPDPIDPAVQRQVFGALPTGVTAITGLTEEGTPRGFVVGTFQSLSLDPPLVTFCVDKGSSTWPTLRSLGRFTANILSTEQLPVCRSLSRKGDEKFKDVAYTESTIGTPRINGAAAWADCEVLSEVVAGDHYMIVGAIVNLEAGSGEALLFRGGKFGDFNLWPAPVPAPTAQPAAAATGKA